MFADLLQRLRVEPAPEPFADDDCRLALAAVMVRLARTDENYTATERAIIDHVLARRYGLDKSVAAALRTEAERLEQAAPDTVQFTRHIKAAVPYAERVGVIEALWRVAISDGIVAEEHAFLRLVANLVGVSDVDSGLARQRVIEKSGG